MQKHAVGYDVEGDEALKTVYPSVIVMIRDKEGDYSSIRTRSSDLLGLGVLQLFDVRALVDGSLPVEADIATVLDLDFVCGLPHDRV